MGDQGERLQCRGRLLICIAMLLARAGASGRGTGGGGCSRSIRPLAHRDLVLAFGRDRSMAGAAARACAANFG